MKRYYVLFLLIFCMTPFIAVAQDAGGGKLTYKPKGAAAVVFSHDYHVNVKGIKCSGCHYHVFQMEKGSAKMEMSRLNSGEFCGKCHSGEKAFDVKDGNNCARCHKKP